MAIKEAVAGGLAGGTQIAQGIAKMLTPGKPQRITVQRGGPKSKVGAPINRVGSRKTSAGGGAGG